MDKTHKFRELTENMVNVYIKKNNAYGDSFSDTFKKLGLISAATSISHKTNRLCSLATNKDIDDLGESLKDTLLDLANYAVMTLIELDAKEEKEHSLKAPETYGR